MELNAHTPEAYCNTSLHLIDKNRSCARPPRGGRPERVATLGVLSTINPKLSPTKKGGGNLFGVVANSLGPSDLTEVKKIGSGNTSSIPQRPPKNETRFWQVRGILGLKIDPQEEQISKKSAG